MAFHCRINAFVYGQPRTLNLKQALYIFLDFRETTVKNIAQEELLEVTARLHILEGLITAADHIDEVIEIIRNSDDRAAARDNLIARYGLSQEQANAILNMTLGRLARADINRFIDEKDEKEERRDYLWNIINDRTSLLNKLKEEFQEIIEKYSKSDKRRSSVLEFDTILASGERPILHERSLLVTTTRNQFMRTIDYSKFKTQGRGGRGVAGVVIDDEDKLLDMVVVSNLDDLLLITTEGIVHQIPAYELPEVRSRTSKGNKIIRYLPVEAPIVKVVNVEYDGFDANKYLVTVTKGGIIKRSKLSEYKNIRRTGIIAAKLKEGDEVVDAFISDGKSILFIATKKGQAAVFEEKKVRAQGRATTGVIAMKVQHGDEVVTAFAVDKSQFNETSILTVTEQGFGKRTPLSEYRLTNRGVKGVRNMKIVSKNGPVVSSMPVPIEAADSNMSLINSDGTLIKVRIGGIRNMGRSTQGVKVMRMVGDQTLLKASSVIDEGEEAEIVIDDEDLAEIAKESETVPEDVDLQEEPTPTIEVEDKDTTSKHSEIDADELEKYLRDTDQ
jgi:DNA gyrase subunit A